MEQDMEPVHTVTEKTFNIILRYRSS